MTDPIYLHITQMTCGGCVRSVSKIISRAGNLDPDQIEVSLDESRATFPRVSEDTLRDILARLDQQGFPSERVSPQPV